MVGLTSLLCFARVCSWHHGVCCLALLLFKGLRPCRRSSLASRLMCVCTTGQVYAVYVATHLSLCLHVYEWACGLPPMNRSKHADEVGINASSDVRRAWALMVVIKQKAIVQIIYLVRCRIWKATSSQRFMLMAHCVAGFS